jgi:hypothetical protein
MPVQTRDSWPLPLAIGLNGAVYAAPLNSHAGSAI